MPELFQYDFMLRALAAGIVVGTVAPAIGIFLVVRRYSLLADTLSHISLVGIAAATLLHVNPVFGAMVASSGAALGIEALREKREIFGESLLALFLSGGLALSILLFNIGNGLNANLFGYLFGSITTVTASDLWIICLFGSLTLLVTLALFKRFFLASYSEDLARANGLPTGMLNVILMLLAAMTVSLSMRVVGILLVGALMVVPVLAATQFGRSFARTAAYATLISVCSVVIGLVTSFYVNLPSGSVIVLVALFFFVASLFLGTGTVPKKV